MPGVDLLSLILSVYSRQTAAHSQQQHQCQLHASTTMLHSPHSVSLLYKRCKNYQYTHHAVLDCYRMSTQSLGNAINSSDTMSYSLQILIYYWFKYANKNVIERLTQMVSYLILKDNTKCMASRLKRKFPHQTMGAKKNWQDKVCVEFKYYVRLPCKMSLF